MPWTTPYIPRELSTNFVIYNFNIIQKRELGSKLATDCDEIAKLFREAPWDTILMRDFESIKDNPGKVKFMMDSAQKVIDEKLPLLAEKCRLLHDKIVELEKNEVEDGSGAKDLLLEMIKGADLLCKGISKEAAENHLKELSKVAQGGRNSMYDKQIELRYDQIKEAIKKVVEGIKKVAKLEFDAGSEVEIVNGALAFGYIGALYPLKQYIDLLNKAGDSEEAEKVKEDFQPLLKFDGDKSLFSRMLEHEELEREIASVVDDETEEDEVKEHCKTILNAVRALPIKYKE